MNHRLEELKKMMTVEPSDPFLKYAFALELEKENNIAESIAALQALQSEMPEYLGTYYQLARMLHQSGLTEEAIKVLQHGLSIAQIQKNNHTLAELRSFLEELSDEDQ